MPTSDMIFAIIGALDFASVFAIIFWTGFVTRKESAALKTQPGGEVTPQIRPAQPRPVKQR
jgi:hypothetical protein